MPAGAVAIGCRLAAILPAVFVAGVAWAAAVADAADASWGDNNITIPLEAGTNLISIPVTPDNPSPADMFAPLGSNLIEVHTFVSEPDGPGQWLSYSPSVPSFLNTLTEIGAGMALVVYMHATDELIIEGQPLGAADVPVEVGWNLLGYNGLSPHLPDDVFGEVSANLDEVFTLAGGEWQHWAPDDPLGIDEVELARAHWVAIRADADLDRLTFDTARYLVLSAVWDLYVEDVSACAATCGSDCSTDPLESDELTLYARIVNRTATAAINADVDFYKKSPDDPDFIWINRRTENVGPAGTSTCIDKYDDGAPIVFDYQTLLKVEVDGGNIVGGIPERNERNNRRVELVHIRMPDPAAVSEELEVSPEFPLTDSAVTLTANLINLGDADADNVTVRFRIEDEHGQSLWTNNVISGVIAPGTTWAATIGPIDLANDLPAGPLSMGTYNVAANIDPDGALKELSKINNTQSQQIFVPDPPTIAVDAHGDSFFCCWQSPNGPKEGDDVHVGVTLTSLGHPSTSTGDIHVEFIHEVISGSGGDETWCPDNSTPCCPDPDNGCSGDSPNDTTVDPITGGQSDWTGNWLQNVAEGTHRVSLELTYCPPDDPNDECMDPTTYAPPPFPDLTVRGDRPDIWPIDIAVDQPFPTVSSNPSVIAHVQNHGETGAGTFPVKLYQVGPGNTLPCIRGGPNEPCIDEAALGQPCVKAEEASLPMLANDGVAEPITYTSWDPASTGWYVLVAVPDPAFDEVYDTATENSCQMETLRVYVRGAGPDLTPTSVWSEPANPIVDQKSKLKARVVNANSEGSAATFNTTFYEDTSSGRELIGTTDQSTTAAGEEAVVVFVDWTPSREGLHRIVAVADDAHAVVESLEDNNESYGTINVRPEPYSIKFTSSDVEVYADSVDNDYDYSIGDTNPNNDPDPAKAWCMAQSMRGCRWVIRTKKKWGITIKYPWFDCDFEDRSSIRIAAYRTFEVKGPEGRSAPADVSLDTKWIGILDDLEANALVVPTGSVYWRVQIVAGIGKGDMSSSLLDYPLRKKTLVEKDTGTVWDKIKGTADALITDALEPSPEARNAAEKAEIERAEQWKNFLTNLAEILKDFFSVDVTFADNGVARLEDVPLQTGETYTAFVYVDLVTAAVGLTSFVYADFYYHQPLIDPVAKRRLPDRGLWLNHVDVSFE